MATLAEVHGSVAALDTKVTAYIAAQVPAAATAADLDAVKSAVDAVTAKVPG